MNKSSFSLVTLVGLTLLMGANASEGGPDVPLVRRDRGTKDGGGGFVGYQADKLLKTSRRALVHRLENVSLPLFREHPEFRDQAIAALNRMHLASTVSRVREGRPLIFDYSRSDGTITALKPFFEIYGNVTEAEIRGPSDARQFTDTYLLREVAHLWNDGDDDASDEFSAAVFGAITERDRAHLLQLVSRIRQILENSPAPIAVDALYAIEVETSGIVWSSGSETGVSENAQTYVARISMYAGLFAPRVLDAGARKEAGIFFAEMAAEIERR